MSTFADYAAYYDLLNSAKDYDAEAAYVERLIGPLERRPAILELGCGTARHACALAARGGNVTGVDRSRSMLDTAERRAAALPPDIAARLSFVHGDAGTYRAGRPFDSVLSLFHVISYQTAQADLEAALRTARAHLDPGGRFVFDVWYGPAVLTQRPEPRRRHIENEAVDITRRAEPRMYPNENVVEVDYHIVVRDKMSGKTSEIDETHRMRYFFVPEMELLLRNAGFALSRYEEWMTAGPAGFDTWSVCFAAAAE